MARALRARAPAASLVAASRPAPRAGAEGTARFAPGRTAGGSHRRLALRARLGALRARAPSTQPGRGLALRARRRGVGAARPGTAEL